jgi:hypothetical protein
VGLGFDFSVVDAATGKLAPPSAFCGPKVLNLQLQLSLRIAASSYS